jgi:hypothetical protein
MSSPIGGRAAIVALGVICAALLPGCRAEAPSPPPSAPATRTAAPDFNGLAARVDPYVAKNRVFVLTDIANEPDDQMSLVRFLVYSNHFDVEGLVATTSTWMRSKVRPDVIHKVLDAYEQVHPTLSKHADGFPTASDLRALVSTGPAAFGMEGVGQGPLSPGADALARAIEKTDDRPLWVVVWGGANTLAEALAHLRSTRATELEALVPKLRVYTISDQDDAGPWIRREFPALHYIAVPSTADGEQYYLATWTGISGDRFYRNADGADFTTFSDEWIERNVRSKGPLGALYIPPCCIHEGDTPSFLGLIDNGLASFMSPSYGGWGGRYVWRQPYGETRPFWTQGGDSYPGRDSSRDTVIGMDGKPRTSDQATIWRWRKAFQHDFAARMDWTVEDPAGANHNPVAIVNGRPGKAPLVIDTEAGQPVTLDASASTDPDGDRLSFRWFFYPEAGTGIPGSPVASGAPVPIGGGGTQADGGIPSAAAGGPPQPPPRVTLDGTDGPRITAVLRTPGTAHVILEVTDTGAPPLTSYRRIVLQSTGR